MLDDDRARHAGDEPRAPRCCDPDDPSTWCPAGAEVCRTRPPRVWDHLVELHRQPLPSAAASLQLRRAIADGAAITGQVLDDDRAAVVMTLSAAAEDLAAVYGIEVEEWQRRALAAYLAAYLADLVERTNDAFAGDLASWRTEIRAALGPSPLQVLGAGVDDAAAAARAAAEDGGQLAPTLAEVLGRAGAGD